MSVKSDYFFYTTSSWMHWSMLGANWKEEEEKVKNQPEENQTKKYEKVKEFGSNCLKKSINYLCGSVGHALTLVTKVMSIVLFFFLSVGFGIHLALSYLTHPSEKHMINRVFRFQMSTITFLDSIVSTAVDSLGVVCPPLAYKIHDYLLNKLANYIVAGGIAMPNIKKENYNAGDAFTVFLNPSV